MIPRGGLDFPVPACINEMHNFFHLRRSGGTGRRAGLKIPWPQGREGSTPSSGTSLFPEPVYGGRTGLRRASPPSGTIIFQAVTCPIVFSEGSFWSTVPLNCASRLLV